MDVVAHCLKQLMKMEAGKIRELEGKVYFSLEKVKSLPAILREVNLVSDIVISPYYLANGHLMEFYEYLFSLRVVESARAQSQVLSAIKSEWNLNQGTSQDNMENYLKTICVVVGSDVQSMIQGILNYMDLMEGKEREMLSGARHHLNTHNQDLEDGIYYEIW